MSEMSLILALILLWGGFLLGILYGKNDVDNKNYKETRKNNKPKAVFRSPLVKYE